MSTQADRVSDANALPVLTVVVVTHNSSNVIERCLGSLGKEDWFDCVVVDCGSTDSTLAKVSGFDYVKVLETQNIGYGRGNNLGARSAESDLILVLNPDVMIDARRLAALVSFFQVEGGNMMLSCKMFQTAPDGSREYRRDSRFTGSLSEEQRLCGALMLMSRVDFTALGGFDENIFLYFEEVDLCRRASAKGLRILIYGEVEVEHMRAASTPKSVEYSVLRGWHDGWSKVYYIRKSAGSRSTASIKIWKSIIQSVIKGSIAWARGKTERAHREAWKVRGMLAFTRGEAAFGIDGRPRYLP